MNITLSPELEAFVAEKVEAGAYHSPNELVQDAVRQLKDREALRTQRLEELRHEIALGLAQADRGDVAPLDIDAIIEKGEAILRSRTG